MPTIRKDQKFKFRPGLLIQIVIAIILGVICGIFFPDWLVRAFLVINSIFSNFLNFIIPLLILGLITPGIANVGDNAGKLLAITVGLAYGSTVIWGMVSFAFANTIFPHIITNIARASTDNMDAIALKPYFTIPMPPVLSVMSALIFAFVLGFGLAATDGNKLKGVMEDFRDIIDKIIVSVIIPLLPVYIFTVFMNIANDSGIFKILIIFIKIILLIFAVTLVMLLILYAIAGLIARRNPFRLLKTMIPAYLTALGTQSSAATIPVTYAQTVKNKVDPDLARFVIPLCATIHMPGSMLKIVACAIAIMMMTGAEVTFAKIAGFVFMLGVTMIAAPGVPGGAIMAAIGLLRDMLGFDDTAQGLMIALYIVMDGFGTATNVTGDGALAVIINKLYDLKKNPKPKRKRRPVVKKTTGQEKPA